jgi:Cu/Ag efflux protein CusF
MSTKILIIAVSIAAFGCQTSPANNSASQLAESPKSSTQPSPSVTEAITNNNVPASNTATVNNAKGLRTFNSKGVVTKINLELFSVEMDHEEIKGLMPAMNMEFFVKDKSQVRALKLGDKVDFVLEDNNGSEVIIDIEKSK